MESDMTTVESAKFHFEAGVVISPLKHPERS